MDQFKMRNQNPYTDRQIRFLKAIREKIHQINDPDPEIITHESYDFHIELTKQFGRIPKIRFTPNSCQIKEEIVEKAGLVDESKEKEISQIRQRYGIRKARNSLANLFESEWNNIMLKAKKATFTLALANMIFSSQHETMAVPVMLLQEIVMDEYANHIKAKKEPIHPYGEKETSKTGEISEIKPYNHELAELD